jgi:hypothetical protein
MDKQRYTKRAAVIAAAMAVVAAAGSCKATPPAPRDMVTFTRQQLFAALQPVTLANCELKRYGEANDGGYLLCANLLGDVKAGYSYGISGYDGWGCDVANTLKVPVHQYDCFDTRRPACEAGTVFHAECVAATPAEIDGRRFDSMANQMAANGDRESHVVVKMDVEGAEWDAFLTAPDETLDRIDQLVIELHGTTEPRFLQAVSRLKAVFHVANLHMNNFACTGGQAPFGAWAYEVLLVNKRIATAGAPRATAFHELDAPNTPLQPDCQVAAK